LRRVKRRRWRVADLVRIMTSGDDGDLSKDCDADDDEDHDGTDDAEKRPASEPFVNQNGRHSL
jgi:hypothetical protein